MTRECTFNQHPQYVLLSRSKEIVVVPDAAIDRYQRENELLLLPESCALELLTPSETLSTDAGNPDDSIMLMLLFPESHHLHSSVTANRNFHHFNDIALRSHPNSSVLWKLRRSCHKGHPQLREEIHFLRRTSFVKAYNYHLYNFWNSQLSTSSFKISYMTLMLSHMLEIIKTSFQNFSGYHLVLTMLKHLDYPQDFLEDCLRQLRNTVTVQTEAYEEFLIALVLDLPIEHATRKIPLEMCMKELSEDNPFRPYLEKVCS